MEFSGQQHLNKKTNITMLMKTICITVLLSLGSLLGMGQKLDKEFFLLGTLDEYMGRCRFGENDTQVDKYYPYEGHITSIIYSLFKKEYPDLECNVEPSGHKKLISKKLSVKVNDYFSLKQKSGSKVFIDNQWLPIYEGNLKEDIFQSDEQKYSYLAGVFLRYGQMQGDTLRGIRFANSAGKVEVCKKLLEQLGCKDIKFKSEDNIPRSNSFTFVPTKKLEAYLQKAMKLRKETPNLWPYQPTCPVR